MRTIARTTAMTAATWRTTGAAALLTALTVAAVVVGLTTPIPAAAQQRPDAVALADSVSRLVHRGAMTGDAPTLRAARTLARRALTAYPGNVLLEHHLAETYYREATRLSESDMERAQALLESAQEILDETVDREGVLPETHALRASVIGMRITGMLKGMTLGPKADNALERGMALDPGTPRVWLAKGISTLHKPGFLGGGADAALEDFERGIALLATHDPAPGHPVGGAAELWAWVGLAHLRSERPAEARAAFKRALEIEPEFGWVRHALLPRVSGGAE